MDTSLSNNICILKALADTSRLMIVNALSEKPQYVEEIAQRLDLAAPTISFHLKKLEEAGLVQKTKKQYYTEYRLNRKLFSATLSELTTFENIEKMAQDERIENYNKKVVHNFFRDGRLLKLPAQLKKRLIILNIFAQKFEAGRSYSENEVNDLITGFYDDYCLIRRELVEFGLMKRKEGQTYWRNPQPVDR